MSNGWDIPPLCKVIGCELPAQAYSKIAMASTNSKSLKKYLKTCRHHNYEQIKKFEDVTAK